MKTTPANLLAAAFLASLLPAAAARAASSWDGKADVPIIVEADPDRTNALYHPGETVTFTVALKHKDQSPADGEVSWVLTDDGFKPPLQTGTAVMKDGKATVTGKLDAPGFLHFEATYKQDKQSYTAIAAAGFDPLKIQPSLPPPADFDAFWAEKKKGLAAVPMNPKMEPVAVPPDRPNCEAFDVKLDCVGGAPVSGYYARPTNAKPKSCAIRLSVPGAGVRSADLLSPVRFASGGGVISMEINAHGILNGQPGSYYAGLDTGELRDYRKRGNTSRDTIYFLGAHLRSLRALEFLIAQPEWDGRTISVEGGSQGGGLALAVAALDPRVTFVVAINPAFCDHSAMNAGRSPGWPKLVTVDPQGKPDPASLEAARYFDSCNFATRIKAEAFMWEGFLDTLCPPSGVYAAYNQLKGKKFIIDDPDHGHGLDGMKLWPKVAAIQKEHYAAMKAKP